MMKISYKDHVITIHKKAKGYCFGISYHGGVMLLRPDSPNPYMSPWYPTLRDAYIEATKLIPYPRKKCEKA